MNGIPPESSPLSPPPLPASETKEQSTRGRAGRYRSTCRLPFELSQHVQVYFEESMFTQGFRLLSSIISADASTPLKPITIPAPVYLATISTLSVHPSLTSRTTAREKWEQSNTALHLLRVLLNTAGPLNAGFVDAFTFTRYHNINGAKRKPGQPDDEDEHDLHSYYADEGSLWSQTEDFWAVVGWVFNCACLPGMYAARWESWSLWLEFMLETLETDWEIHYENNTCDESLFWHYIELAPGGNNRARRMLRAIFADGSTPCLNEFRPVFRKELKEPPSDADRPKKREVDVNVEAEIYGDYLVRDQDDTTDSSDDEQSVSQHRHHKRVRRGTPSRRPTPRTSNQSLRSEFDVQEQQGQAAGTFSASPLGPPRSLALRLRLLHLLSHIAGHDELTAVSPTTFPNLDELYTLYVEFIKPLSLSVFQQLLTPSILHGGPGTDDDLQVFSADAHTTLCEFLLQRTIESTAPSVRSEAYLTQRKLEEEYLPFGASRDTVDANCRVSLLLEALLRRLKQAKNGVKPTEDLSLALENGIQRRLDKVQSLHPSFFRVVNTNKVTKRSANHSKNEDFVMKFDGDSNIEDEDDDNDDETVVIATGNTSTSNSNINGSKKRKKKGIDQLEEEIAWNWLVESGERMRVVIKSLK